MGRPLPIARHEGSAVAWRPALSAVASVVAACLVGCTLTEPEIDTAFARGQELSLVYTAAQLDRRHLYDSEGEEYLGDLFANPAPEVWARMVRGDDFDHDYIETLPVVGSTNHPWWAFHGTKIEARDLIEHGIAIVLFDKDSRDNSSFIDACVLDVTAADLEEGVEHGQPARVPDQIHLIASQDGLGSHSCINTHPAQNPGDELFRGHIQSFELIFERHD